MRDRVAEIAEDFSILADDLQVHGEYVLIEVNQAETKIGMIDVPPEAMERYPTSGWIVSVGSQVKDKFGLEVGSYVLIEEEGASPEQTYYDVFEIKLRLDDGEVDTLWAPIEVEPVIRERVLAYRRGGGQNHTIHTKDVKAGESISFNCSDVLTWQMGEIANSNPQPDYLPCYMFIFTNGEGQPNLFYITKPNNILAVVEY